MACDVLTGKRQATGGVIYEVDILTALKVR
jgi:hypothetical protein